MSLLGKPLNYNRGARRDARYRRLQSRIYNFLERPRGIPAILYHVIVFFMVFTCLALSVFSTIEGYEKEAIIILIRMEILVVIWFTIEFALRLWSSGCRSRYQGGVGRLKFLRRPFCIIDVITIAASLIVIAMGTSGQVFTALRGLRFFQILRMVRMDRRGGTWKLLGSVVYAHRQELITTLYIGFLGLIFASFLVYLMEKDVNKKFNNFAQALWWGVITLCTVGYGDMVPETWQGKIIASFCALLGISFFALPAGILGSGFALKVQQQQRQKHMIRRRQPAATLIQSLWRCYAADEHSVSVATWKIHQVPLPSPPPSSKLETPKEMPSTSSAMRASSSFKHNASFVARLPTIRRHKSQSLHSPGNPKPPAGSARGRVHRINDMNTSAENLDGFEFSTQSVNDIPNNYASAATDLNNHIYGSEASENQSNKQLQQPQPQSGSAHNNLALIKIGEATALPVMLCGLLQKELFYQQTQINQQKEYMALSQNNSDYFKNHRNSFCNEDDEPRCVQLTNQHKTAIRFIRKMKYFVARRKFKEALKPYDVKDVMEQYAAGHVDLLGRVKNVQTRLDQILGKQGSKAKDVYASKISLASRVVKVERSVADIEEKLDILIKAYMQDRERFLALPQVPDTQHSITPKNPPNPPPGGASGTGGILTSSLTTGSGTLKPKPILVDKQFSEPNSPITKTFDQTVQRRPPMHRGFSDLGNRIKKRVTLSSIPPQYVGSNQTYHHDGSGDVVIVVPAIDGSQNMEEIIVSSLPEHSICIETEADIEPTSPKTMTESSIVIMDEEVEEDIEEEDLDCEGEMDPESPPWDDYGDEDIEDGDIDDTTEDTALLRASAAKTEIVITPMSPVNSSVNLTRLDSDGKSGNNNTNNGNKKSMDLLTPEMTPEGI
ncbi:potassium voltage-gated channel subfamily KQT member 2 isoform X3 [Bradysia coprophila]|uniref:potassium voltage-gated channel subfamily KQT member 2 isoform X3 n=1 Tax=Bradysia coprophila TaxID=38358 RepID=UPI00187DA8BA|nr:potassium voltage-gated channel subfamily KQT member 2 isoform X3 [Bradysia coprophila]